jgi:DNA-binding XRE family transcriptional regulator
MPVISTSLRSSAGLGVVEPDIHSDTDACLIPSSSPSRACVVSVSSSQALSRCMDANIGDSYSASIGDSFGALGQHQRMQKKAVRTFWIRVKEALEDSKLPATQAYVAKFLHVAQPSVSDWNKAGGFPTLENAIKLAHHLHVCVEWLYTENGPKRPLPPDVVAQRLWDLWPRLDDATKGEIVGIARARTSAGGATLHSGNDTKRIDGR